MLPKLIMIGALPRNDFQRRLGAGAGAGVAGAGTQLGSAAFAASAHSASVQAPGVAHCPSLPLIRQMARIAKPNIRV